MALPSNVPAVMVLMAIAVAMAANIRQFEIYNLLVLPWIIVGLTCYVVTGGDVALLIALQGAAVLVLMVVVAIQVVHALGHRY